MQVDYINLPHNRRHDREIESDKSDGAVYSNQVRKQNFADCDMHGFSTQVAGMLWTGQLDLVASHQEHKARW